MATNIVPVTCPRCKERQNKLIGGFHPDRKPFGGAACMVCGHGFTEDEYRRGLAAAQTDLAARRIPESRA